MFTGLYFFFIANLNKKRIISELEKATNCKVKKYNRRIIDTGPFPTAGNLKNLLMKNSQVYHVLCKDKSGEDLEYLVQLTRNNLTLESKIHKL